jgi:hypothetical protein
MTLIRSALENQKKSVEFSFEISVIKRACCSFLELSKNLLFKGNVNCFVSAKEMG